LTIIIGKHFPSQLKFRLKKRFEIRTGVRMISPKNKIFIMKLNPYETRPQVQEQIYRDDSMYSDKKFVLFINHLFVTLRKILSKSIRYLKLQKGTNIQKHLYHTVSGCFPISPSIVG
jgi:hypothetical protein